MKKILFVFAVALVQFTFAQNDVVFKINHKLSDSEDITLTSKGKNNLDDIFTLTRLEYYLSDFSITHDGGQVLSFQDTTILVDVFSETNISLGNHDVTNLESLRFNLGVKEALNHLDPALYSSDHPLSPKSPSMHWGWTSGYRFFAIEGDSDGQAFELHGVGDALYEEIEIFYTETTVENNVLVLDVNAEYNEALRATDLSSNVNIHGDENNPEIVTVKNNFINTVFTANEGEEDPNSIFNKDLNKEVLSIFPNPTNGKIYIESDLSKSVVVYNSIGEKISTAKIVNNSISIQSKGVYLLHLLDKKNNLVSINKVIVY